MSDARSVLKEMKITQAEHLPLVAAFLERMGVAAFDWNGWPGWLGISMST